MGKSSFSFRRSVSRRRTKKTTAPPPRRSPPQPPYAAGITASPDGAANNGLVAGAGASALTKVKKKTGSARLWMRFDRSGRSELVEWEKNAIVHHAAIPARDLRILGPVFSHSSNILGNRISLSFRFSVMKFIVFLKEGFYKNRVSGIVFVLDAIITMIRNEDWLMELNVYFFSLLQLERKQWLLIWSL